ncbi:MAG: hypothetical protein ACRC6I_07835, partial [Paracoccaceae bacterium]
ELRHLHPAGEERCAIANEPDAAHATQLRKRVDDIFVDHVAQDNCRIKAVQQTLHRMADCMNAPVCLGLVNVSQKAAALPHFLKGAFVEQRISRRRFEKSIEVGARISIYIAWPVRRKDEFPFAPQWLQIQPEISYQVVPAKDENGFI